MAYSVQIYRAYLTKKPDEIKALLEKEKRKTATSQEHGVKITKVSHEEDRGWVRLSMTVNISADTYQCDVTVNQPKNHLLIQAPATTRHRIKEFLAQVIEDSHPSGIIQDNDLKIDQSLKLFDRITKEGKTNIIEILTINFEPELGYKYDREIYTELSYKFIQNRCASDHRDFTKLCRNGHSMTMKLAISKCRNLVNDGSIKLIVKPDSSFRVYSDIAQDIWDDFCFNTGYVAGE